MKTTAAMETAILIQMFLGWICLRCAGQAISCRDPGSFACGDGTCISLGNYCNEVHPVCTRTRADAIFCDDDCPPNDICKYTLHGPCVFSDRRCSGDIDCADASDELGCEILRDGTDVLCRTDQYLCPLTLTCLDYTRLCDDIPDCGRFDEEFCNRYCYPENITLGTPEHGERVQLLHYGLANPDTGFYKCTWSVVAEVTSYIFIKVMKLHIPRYGKFRLSAVLGESPVELSETIFFIETSVLPSQRVYVTGLTRTAWIHISSSRLVEWSWKDDLSPRIELTFSLHHQRICPSGFIECPNQSGVNLCIAPSAVCDGHLDCPDYWDESQCSEHQAVQDLCGPQTITFNTTHQVITREAQAHFEQYNTLGVDCLWFVQPLPQSRIQIILDTFKGDGSTLTIGTATDFGMGLTADATTEFVKVRAERLSLPVAHSPMAGVPIWIATHLAPGTVTHNSLLRVHLKYLNETECGPEEFSCGGKVCFPLSEQCNGIPQCPLLSDEKGCGTCEPSTFTCDGGTCLKDEFVCDGLAHCSDMMDEFLCGRCGNTPPAVRLTNNRPQRLTFNLAETTSDCLFLITASSPSHGISVRLLRIPQVNIFIQPELSFGDGHNPSNTSSLLHSVPFTREGLPVRYPKVVTSQGSQMWIAYRFSDYVYEDDFSEYNAKSLDMKVVQFNLSGCQKNGKYLCAPRACIDQSAVCDGYVDCLDYSDETGCSGCPTDEFRCVSEDKCIPRTRLCDRSSDCTDGSDESVCGPCGRNRIELSHHEGRDAQPFLLKSPFYPMLVSTSSHFDCTWTIVASPDHHVIAEIDDFRLNTGPDNVRFGWGQDVGNLETVIGPELKGKNLVLAAVVSRDRYMWISLHVYSFRGYPGIAFRLKSGETVTCQEDQIACGLPDLLCLQNSTTRYQWLYFCSDDICGKRSVFLEEGTPYFLASPNYPNVYPAEVHCNWEFHTLPVQHQQVFLLVTVLDFRTENRRDTVTISSPGFVFGDKSRNARNELILDGTTSITSVTSLAADIYINFTTDSSVERQGFQLRVDAYMRPPKCSGEQDLHCENTTFCISEDAVCNGFQDCAYEFDEQQCFSIKCPDFYQCSRSNECILWDNVCDGTENCLLGDDERNCDVKRCPDECKCYYKDSDLYVICHNGWTKDTLDNIAAITDVLHISGGNSTSLGTGYFKQFINLKALYLTSNRIERISPLAFEGLTYLNWLNISDNNFSKLEKQSFAELQNLDGIIISDVPLVWIEKAAFEGLRNLRTMVLIRGKYKHLYDESIQIEQDALSDLTNLETLYLDDYTLCCEFGTLENFQPENCFTTELQSPLYNCGSLMRITTLAVFMWILGLSAMLGNFGVVAWRCWTLSKLDLGRGTKYVHNFLVLNLAISDFLMGVYMIIIAAAHVHFGDRYYQAAKYWRQMGICKLAGIISVLSSEASVFFITLISLDRFFCITLPHGVIRLTRPTARLSVALIWLVSLALSSVPIILVGSDTESDVYGLSDVCIGLPLVTKPANYKLKEGGIGNPLGSQSFSIPVPQDSRPAWVYSIILFLGINFVCFLIIAVCYTAIFIRIRLSHQRLKRSRIKGTKLSSSGASSREEINMALRLAVIVGTDFCCWMPVILMGILSQSGAVTIQPHMYAWTVVFILPINSSINPYLYTIFSIVSTCQSNQKHDDQTKNDHLPSSNHETIPSRDTAILHNSLHHSPEEMDTQL